MMGRLTSSSQDIIADLQRQIRELEERLGRVENRKKITIPVYNKGSLPDMIEQEIFIGTDNSFNFIRGGTVHIV